jgi:AcrR family transcriptional regulator
MDADPSDQAISRTEVSRTEATMQSRDQRREKRSVNAKAVKTGSARSASGPQRDPERTRAAILAAATQEFTVKGFSGARVDTIAKRAGINKRMLYHYFGDKEGLYLAVLEATYTSIRTAEVGLNLRDLGPVEGVRKLVLFTWQYFIDHPEFLSLLGTENMLRAQHLKRSKRIQHLHAPLVGMISELVERGVKAKAFRTGIDPVDLYITIASLGFFYMSNRHTLSTIFAKDLGTPARLDARGRHIVEVVLAYLAPHH